MYTYIGFHRRSGGQEAAFSAGDAGSLPGQEDPLEEEMATHASTLAWRIPQTEEPGGLQSMGSQESDMTEPLNKNHDASRPSCAFSPLPSPLPIPPL